MYNNQPDLQANLTNKRRKPWGKLISDLFQPDSTHEQAKASITNVAKHGQVARDDWVTITILHHRYPKGSKTKRTKKDLSKHNFVII